MRLTESFYRRKVAQFQNELKRRDLKRMLILDYKNIWYLTGFFYFPTERPVAVFVPVDDEPALFIPKLEEDQVRGNWMSRVETYFEYPGVKPPLEYVADFLSSQGLDKEEIGFEGSTAVRTLRQLKELLPDVTWVETGEIIAQMRLVKDEEEIALIRKAAEYSDFMVCEGVRILKEKGLVTELELLREVVNRTADKMLAELGDIVYVGGIADGLVCSGERSAFPHGLPSNRKLQRGDNLILSFGCVVGGYNAESERTFFIGKPSDRQREFYQLLQEAQQKGTMALTTGQTCAAANRICLDTIRGAGFGQYIKHRQGHGIGIANHEPPWIEDGDQTVLRANMVVSSEPGIYVPDEGGFRISDTVLITDAGPERLTRFPRNLEDVLIEP